MKLRVDTTVLAAVEDAAEEMVHSPPVEVSSLSAASKPLEDVVEDVVEEDTRNTYLEQWSRLVLGEEVPCPTVDVGVDVGEGVGEDQET